MVSVSCVDGKNSTILPSVDVKRTGDFTVTIITMFRLDVIDTHRDGAWEPPLHARIVRRARIFTRSVRLTAAIHAGW